MMIEDKEMTLQEAKCRVDDHWRDIIEEEVGHAVQIDDALTVEHSWGWVFCFVSVSQQPPKQKEAYVCDRLTGESCPIGTKSIENAVQILMSWRAKLAHGKNFE
jgi:hypothetical protein